MKLIQKPSQGKKTTIRTPLKKSYINFKGQPCSVQEWMLEAPLRKARADGDYKKLYQLRKQLKR